MKRLTLPALLSLGLVFGAIGCVDQAKTSADAPKNTQEQPKPLDTEEAKTTDNDAQSQVRRDQLNSDIRAREQRNNVANNGSALNRDDSDLASQVRSKLEANLPSSALVVDSKEGVVTVSGTVPTPEQLARIEPLAKEIKGVNSVQVKAQIVKAQPKENKQSYNQNSNMLVASNVIYNDLAQSSTTKPNSSGTGGMNSNCSPGSGTSCSGGSTGSGTSGSGGSMGGTGNSGSGGSMGTGTSGDSGTSGGAMDNSGSTGAGSGSSGNGGSGGSGGGSGGSGGGGK